MSRDRGHKQSRVTTGHRCSLFLSRRSFGRSFRGIRTSPSGVAACLFLLGETQPNPTNDDVAIRIQCLILCPTLSGMSRSRPTSCARAETISTDDDATSKRVYQVHLGLRPQATLQTGSRPRALSQLRVLTGQDLRQARDRPKPVLLKRRSATLPRETQRCALRGRYGPVRSTRVGSLCF